MHITNEQHWFDFFLVHKNTFHSPCATTYISFIYITFAHNSPCTLSYICCVVYGAKLPTNEQHQRSIQFNLLWNPRAMHSTYYMLCSTNHIQLTHWWWYGGGFAINAHCGSTMTWCFSCNHLMHVVAYGKTYFHISVAFVLRSSHRYIRSVQTTQIAYGTTHRQKGAYLRATQSNVLYIDCVTHTHTHSVKGYLGGLFVQLRNNCSAICWN